MGRTESRCAAAPDPLTHVELRVLAEYARGRSSNEIATELFLSERSVRRRLRAVRQAFDVETTIEAVVIAVRRGLL